MLKSMMSLTNSVQKLVKIGKMKDSVTTGLVGGLMGAVAMELSSVMLFKTKKTEVTYGRIAGQFFVAPFRTKQKKNWLLGELLHLAVGATAGIPTLMILKKTGKDHYLSKGLLASMLTWGIFYNGGQRIGLFKSLAYSKTHWASTFNNLVYGLVTSQSIVWLADPSIFRSSTKATQETWADELPDTNNYSDINVTGQEPEPTDQHILVH